MDFIGLVLESCCKASISPQIGDIKPSDFCPKSEWSYGEDNVHDKTSNREYGDFDDATVRCKGLAIFLAGAVIHPFSIVVKFFVSLAFCISGRRFWNTKVEGGPTLQERWKAFGTDLLRIVLAPLLYVGLVIAAIVTMIAPLDGRKLYGSMERFTFGREAIAPCFQPEATHHMGGGLNTDGKAW